MLWFVIALQALTPFVHAHAGALPQSHAGLLHVHAGVPGDVAYHAMESGEQGEDVEVAAGVLLRQAAWVVASVAAPAVRPSEAMALREATALPTAPPLHPPLPDHALPPALAPPLR